MLVHVGASGGALPAGDVMIEGGRRLSSSEGRGVDVSLQGGRGPSAGMGTLTVDFAFSPLNPTSENKYCLTQLIINLFFF